MNKESGVINRLLKALKNKGKDVRKSYTSKDDFFEPKKTILIPLVKWFRRK